MRRISVYQVDAFTDRPLAGNPAGVVWDAAELADDTMQAVARELSCSETVFVLPPTDPTAQLHFRFFTPVREVPLCGHATVAACHLGVELGELIPAVYRLQTAAGMLGVDIRSAEEGCFLHQAPPRFRSLELPPARLAAVLGLTTADIAPSPALASTGLWHLLVPLVAPGALDRAAPDLEQLGRLNAELGADTTHLFCLGAIPAAPIQMRDFAPQCGVREDPQTGTAAGAMAAWLAHTGLVALPARLMAEQGRQMGRPGRLFIELDGSDGEPRSVRVGGTAVTVLSGQLALPD
ncbi:MAG: PhzF family phenazine biosynthesis protein [Thermaerobacter sp.]|nr:PhzF family phenazine biosynthesis protein [Thermaerobacter sp.]